MGTLTNINFSKKNIKTRYIKKIVDHKEYSFFMEYEIMDYTKFKYRFYKKFKNLIFKYSSNWITRNIYNYKSYIEQDFMRSIKEIDENQKEQFETQKNISISTIIMGTILFILI